MSPYPNRFSLTTVSPMGQTLSAPMLLDAIQHDSLLKVMQIIDKKKATARSKLQSGNMACHMAAESGSVELLNAIIQGYSNTNRHPTAEGYISKLVCLRNSAKRTPLMLACLKGHAPMVQQLLQLGADVWDADGSCGVIGRTALHMACRAGKLETVRVLLQWVQEHPGQEHPLGAQVKLVDAKTDAGFTPAHYAIHGKSAEILKLLLLEGAAVSPRCSSHCSCDLSYPSGSTPLHVAATTGSLDCIQLLLTAHESRLSTRRAGGPASLVRTEMDPRCFLDEEGHTPFAVAFANRRWDCLALLSLPTPSHLDMVFNRFTGEWGYGPERMSQEAAKATHIELLSQIGALSEQLENRVLAFDAKDSMADSLALGGVCSNADDVGPSQWDWTDTEVDQGSTMMQDENEESSCPVCLDTLTPTNQLDVASCCHSLCVSCAGEIVRMHRLKLALCPLCRVAIGGFSLPR